MTVYNKDILYQSPDDPDPDLTVGIMSSGDGSSLFLCYEYKISIRMVFLKWFWGTIKLTIGGKT